MKIKASVKCMVQIFQTFFSFTGHEKDLQSLPKVPGVEAETRAQPEAVEVPRAEHATLHQCR